MEAQQIIPVKPNPVKKLVIKTTIIAKISCRSVKVLNTVCLTVEPATHYAIEHEDCESILSPVKIVNEFCHLTIATGLF